MEFKRDQYLEYMRSREVDRPMLVELFGLLVGLEEEWRNQGASDEEINLTAFDFDFVRKHGVNVFTGFMTSRKEEMIEETEEYVIKRDSYGRTIKLIKGKATIALPLDYPVKDMDSWLAVKEGYRFSPERFAPGWEEEARRARENGALIVVHIPGGFDEPRQLMGEENLCLAYYGQPELVKDMLTTMGETAYKVLDRVSSRVKVDLLSVHEDLAGKSGSLIGPRQIDEFVRPYYRRTWDMLRERGAVLFQQDSDGNLDGVIPAFRNAGVNTFYPMEPAAGMDMVETRKTEGEELCFLGGIDKHAIRQGKEKITAELEYKLQPLTRKGGVVFGLDHRIPNGTPLEAYRYYVRTAKEILGIPVQNNLGWERMAF